MTAETNKFNFNNDKPKDYEELTEAQKIESEIDAIHKELIEGGMTIKNAKTELEKIKHWLQQKENIDPWYKEQISSAFDKLTNNLEKNIKDLDAEKSREEFETEKNGILEIVHNSTNKQLARLRQSVQHPTLERPKDVQEWIEKAAENLNQTIADARNDGSRIVKHVIGPWLERANKIS